jgi:hypothetical protein
MKTFENMVPSEVSEKKRRDFLARIGEIFSPISRRSQKLQYFEVDARLLQMGVCNNRTSTSKDCKQLIRVSVAHWTSLGLA